MNALIEGFSAVNFTRQNRRDPRQHCYASDT